MITYSYLDGEGKKTRMNRRTVGSDEVYEQFSIPLEAELSVRVAYNAGGDVEYIGKAEAGSSTSSATWQISRLFYDGSGNFEAKLWCDGDFNYDNVWDDRASLTYV